VPLEVEKVERRDPVKRLGEKVMVQKTIASHALREQSPIRRATKGSTSARGRPPNRSHQQLNAKSSSKMINNNDKS